MAESKVNRSNYITVQGFMVRDLQLKGNELLVYAIIYGFSQAESQVFNGSLQYLADWTNSTKQGVIKCLKSLVEKEYIQKTEKIINGVKFCEYYATNLTTVLNKIEYPVENSLTDGIQHSLPNNIGFNNLKDNIAEREKPRAQKHKKGEYGHVLLTDEQEDKLIEEYGEIVTAKAIVILDEYIEMKGYKAKNHYLAIKKWVIDAVKEREPKQGSFDTDDFYEAALRKACGDELYEKYYGSEKTIPKTAADDDGIRERADRLKGMLG